MERILAIPVMYTGKIGVNLKKSAGTRKSSRSYLVSLLCNECVEFTILVFALL